MINQKRLIATFLRLVRINAPAKAERPLADFLLRHFRRYQPQEDKAGKLIGGNAGNILMRIPGYGGMRPLLLSAHMDTVQPTAGIRPRIAGGLIKTDGNTILGADDRAGIAAILEAVTALQENNVPHPPLELLFTAAEEIGLLGAKQLRRGELKSAMGFVLDSSLAVGKAVHDAVSIQRMIVRVQGHAAHAGVEPEKGVNAIAIAAKALACLRIGRLDPHTTFNVGTIRAGHAFNIVPAQAQLEMEARSRFPKRLQGIVAGARRAFASAARQAGGSVHWKDWTDFECFRVPKNAPVSRVFCRGAAQAGLRPELRAYSGGSDANVFNKIGIPSLVLGVGYKHPHAHNESIAIAELTRCARLVAALVQAYGDYARR